MATELYIYIYLFLNPHESSRSSRGLRARLRSSARNHRNTRNHNQHEITRRFLENGHEFQEKHRKNQVTNHVPTERGDHNSNKSELPAREVSKTKVHFQHLPCGKLIFLQTLIPTLGGDTNFAKNPARCAPRRAMTAKTLSQTLPDTSKPRSFRAPSCSLTSKTLPDAPTAVQTRKITLQSNTKQCESIAGIAASTKSQESKPARNRSQHEITVSTVRAKPQPARNRSQHEFAISTVRTKPQLARNQSQHEITTTTKSQTQVGNAPMQ
jgi:hypothetical protein